MIAHLRTLVAGGGYRWRPTGINGVYHVESDHFCRFARGPGSFRLS